MPGRTILRLSKNQDILKKSLTWLLITGIIYLVLATVVMFSRETTLHGVRSFDFKIYAQSAKLLPKNTIHSDFKKIADVLTIKNGKKVFFPLAILDSKSCTENGNRDDDTLCKMFPTSKSFMNASEDATTRNRYGATIYDMPNGESYFFKKLTNDKIIIGEAGKYLTGNVSLAFMKFFKDDWYNYFLTWNGEPGKYGGIKKTWEKTDGIFYVIFTISLFLFLLHIWHEEKRKKEYIDLKKQIQKTDNKLYELNVEFNQLNQKRTEIDNDIVTLYKQYAKDDENEQYKTQLDKFIEEQKTIETNINKKKEEIISLEHLDQELSNKIMHKTEKVSSSIAHKELQKLIEKLHSIKKLWQRELSWREREQLEQEVTGHKRKIPFTLSQSFILFEKEVVYKMAKKCDGFVDDMRLIDMIKLIARERLINNIIESRFHKIRKARNKWMHDAKLPSEDVIKDLITILHVYKVEPVV